MSDFAIFAENGISVTPLLPLVHTTDWHRFRTLKQIPVLEPRACKVYGEDLLYFFYGKPCYRPHDGVEPTSLSAFHLVSLVVDGATLPTPKRILPFDSGAFRRGFYEPDTHPAMDLPHFEINPTLDAASRTVGQFFGSNKAYFRTTVRPDLIVNCDDLEVEAYVSIVSSRKKGPIDERRSAIEVQIASAVKLLGSKVHAVILPEHFLDDDPTYRFITDQLGAEPLGYFCPHARPAEDARAIMGEAFKFYKTRGWL